jgi:hypothetical protein
MGWVGRVVLHTRTTHITHAHTQAHIPAPIMKQWDTAAADIIVREAGGLVVRAGKCSNRGELLEDWKVGLLMLVTRLLSLAAAKPTKGATPDDLPDTTNRHAPANRYQPPTDRKQPTVTTDDRTHCSGRSQ